MSSSTTQSNRFQSTPPVWGATPYRRCRRPSARSHFNPRPPCGGRPRPSCPIRSFRHFNPRPPCGGRRNPSGPGRCSRYFNPRPPCGGRPPTATGPEARRNFNPRPPCGGRRVPADVYPLAHIISIHAPRVGGDRFPRLRGPGRREFQSTPPVWGATKARSLRVHRFFNFNPRPPCGGRHG